MTLASTVALTKRVPAGEGVSYLHRYVTERETTLALVPLGYADGVPRAATNVGQVQLGGRRRTIAGTVCMDQFLLDVGDDAVSAGDEVLLFGPGDDGEPTAQEWAEALGTINYEIVTRVGARVPRTLRRRVGREPRAHRRAARRQPGASPPPAPRSGLTAERKAVGQARLRPDPEAREPFFALPADRTPRGAHRRRRPAARRGGRAGSGRRR